MSRRKQVLLVGGSQNMKVVDLVGNANYFSHRASTHEQPEGFVGNGVVEPNCIETEDYKQLGAFECIFYCVHDDMQKMINIVQDMVFDTRYNKGLRG